MYFYFSPLAAWIIYYYIVILLIISDPALCKTWHSLLVCQCGFDFSLNTPFNSQQSILKKFN